jgi:hypothetical protein
MKLRRSTPEPAPAPPPEPRLEGVPRLQIDDEERPSRQDLDYGQTVFTRRPVPIPRWLAGKKRRF